MVIWQFLFVNDGLKLPSWNEKAAYEYKLSSLATKLHVAPIKLFNFLHFFHPEFLMLESSKSNRFLMKIQTNYIYLQALSGRHIFIYLIIYFLNLYLYRYYVTPRYCLKTCTVESLPQWNANNRITPLYWPCIIFDPLH